LIPEVLVRGGDFAVVRERITVDDMLAREPLPPWLGLRPVEETGT
jgi:diaminopimelate decarboxylase